MLFQISKNCLRIPKRIWGFPALTAQETTIFNSGDQRSTMSCASILASTSRHSMVLNHIWNNFCNGLSALQRVSLSRRSAKSAKRLSKLLKKSGRGAPGYLTKTRPLQDYANHSYGHPSCPNSSMRHGCLTLLSGVIHTTRRPLQAAGFTTT